MSGRHLRKNIWDIQPTRSIGRLLLTLYMHSLHLYLLYARDLDSTKSWSVDVRLWSNTSNL